MKTIIIWAIYTNRLYLFIGFWFYTNTIHSKFLIEIATQSCTQTKESVGLWNKNYGNVYKNKLGIASKILLLKNVQSIHKFLKIIRLATF